VKHFILGTALVVGIISVGTLGASARVQSNAGMTLAVQSKSGPHSISSQKDLVTFYFKITGLTMDTHYPGKSVTGHGHVQIYLDKVPSDAYKKKDLHHLANADVPGKTGKNTYAVSIEFDSAWIKEHKGQHVLRVGLAANSMVMYHVPIVSFNLDVK